MPHQLRCSFTLQSFFLSSLREEELTICHLPDFLSCVSLPGQSFSMCRLIDWSLHHYLNMITGNVRHCVPKLPYQDFISQLKVLLFYFYVICLYSLYISSSCFLLSLTCASQVSPSRSKLFIISNQELKQIREQIMMKTLQRIKCHLLQWHAWECMCARALCVCMSVYPCLETRCVFRRNTSTMQQIWAKYGYKYGEGNLAAQFVPKQMVRCQREQRRGQIKKWVRER